MTAVNRRESDPDSRVVRIGYLDNAPATARSSAL